ncbi:hypothetical protein PENANT_c001G09913 [Penicillium antarcticum]|uniref:Ig-like domain-containing protein n=1 Tax=Penicillium antarcticum TaxID=416450 RepID=A0A1V6QNC2_9EURO|nr:hypothetical protein PENANT_c001G09913 [Penicillium antarcticum]
MWPLAVEASYFTEAFKQSPTKLYGSLPGEEPTCLHKSSINSVTHSASGFAAIQSRIRVYAVSDQDDTGAWIRQQFPDFFYISSTYGWNQYGLAIWIGISEEDNYGVDQGGPDNTTVSHQWLRKNIQVGPYGKEAYLDFNFILEGDTPTFLYLIHIGLGVSDEPYYESWGGRLRDAYQNDFAARMQWSLPANTSKPNHYPIISVNGSAQRAPLNISVAAGSTLTFNVAATFDPDGDRLTFNWLQYQEPGSSEWNVAGQMPQSKISSVDGGRKAQMQVPAGSESCDGQASTSSGCWLLHVILEVTDDRYHPLTSYHRIWIQTTSTMKTSS